MSEMLITGGNGFLGSAFASSALKRGHSVTVIDDFSTSTQGRLPEGVTIIRERVEDAEIKGDFDFIMHLAARPSPDDYVSHPVDTLLSNSVGTLRMAELALRCGCPILYTSSSEVYGNASILPTPESYWGQVSPTGIRSCYDEGKRFSEALLMAFHRDRGLDVRIQRPFNVYGPGIRADGQYGRVIPRFITQALKGEAITVHGDGKQTRSFLYVDDWLRATWKMLESKTLSGTVLNIGSEREVTISRLAEMVREIAASESPIIHLPPREDDPVRRSADISLARRLLEWEPEVPLEQGLSKTVSWFRERL